MSSQMRIDDEIRVNILDALLRKRSVIPNLKQVKKYTGYHKATIKSSIDFLLKEGLLEGFGPKVNFRKLGYKLEVVSLLQADLSEKKTLEKFLEIAEKDPHIYLLSGMIGSGNWNIIARHIFKDVESYHSNMEKKYYEAIPKIYDLIRDRQIFYTTEPFYKTASRTKSIIEIIKREKGFD